MLIPLRSERRRSLLRGSLFSLVGAILVAPLALPPALPAQADDHPATPSQSAPPLQSVEEPRLVIARDPFVPEVASETGEGGGSTSEAGGIVVEAVALGSSPRALVQTGSASRIVGVGDALGDSTVASIDARGVTLQSGETLTLTVPQ